MTQIASSGAFRPTHLNQATSREEHTTNDRPNVLPLPAFSAHIDFFDTNHDGTVSFLETVRGIHKLGYSTPLSIGSAAILHGGLTGFGAFAGILVNTFRLPLPQFEQLRHKTDTRIINDQGEYDENRANEIFAQYGNGETLDFKGVLKLIGSDFARDLPQQDLRHTLAALPEVSYGAVGSFLEFFLLYVFAARLENRSPVLDKDTLRKFYTDPNFFQSIADKVEAKRENRSHTFWGKVLNALAS